MIILYDTITNDTLRLVNRFNLPSREIRNYREQGEKIILLSRRLLIDEKINELKTFLLKNRKNIIGVVIYDNKSFGDEFGSSAELFAEAGIKVLRVWDKIVSDREIESLKEELNEFV